MNPLFEIIKLDIFNHFVETEKTNFFDALLN